MTLSVKKVINLYNSYTLGPQLRNFNTDFTLSNCLKLTKNADSGEYKYTGYGLGSDSRGEYSFPNASAG